MKRIDKRSILVRVLICIVCVSILQTVVLAGLLLFGGTVTQLNENSTAVLIEHNEKCAHEMQSDMLERWGNMEVLAGQFQSSYEAYLQDKQITSETFDAEQNYQKEFIVQFAPALIQMLRENKVNGVFLILNGADAKKGSEQEETVMKQGISIWDMDQEAGYLDREDLFLNCAPTSVTERINVPLDYRWKAVWTFEEGQYSDYYYKPLAAAKDNPQGNWRDLGYWSELHNSPFTDTSLISYSIPLMDAEGHVVGVAGIEVMEEYLRKQLLAEELNDSKEGAYMLVAKDKEADNYCILTENGYPYYQYTKKEGVLSFDKEPVNGCYRLQTKNTDSDVYASIKELDLYSDDTMFENEKWYLVALLNQKELYEFSKKIETALYMSVVIALVSALAVGIILGRNLVRPIRNLSKELQNSNTEDMLALNRTKIGEIDQLVTEIERLQNSLLDSNHKLSTILNLSEAPIGAFELDLEKKKVFFTDYFFKILDYKIEEGDVERLKTYDAFVKKFKQQDEVIVVREEDDEKDTATYHFRNPEGKEKWVRVRAVRRERKMYGIILDVTQEFQEKIKLQYERDHDVLTKLYNRWAFHEKIQKLFGQPMELGIAAMLMLDLDNLKYVNDSYGHDSGDAYIKAAADGMEECRDEKMLLARMSGDEFYIFLHHYNNRGDIEEKIKLIHENVRKKFIKTWDKEIPVRITGGIAWFPEDTQNYTDLITYADFAMYQAKRYSKGEFVNFSKEEYERDSFLLRNCGELNVIIEGEQVKYYFQPIVDANTGEIFAYEALIRPISLILKRPDELIRLAKSQGRLYQLERLTWKKALGEFRQNEQAMQKGCKIFINSVSSQILNAHDFIEIEKENHDVLDRVVMELTEEERVNNQFTDEKRAYLNKWKAQLALDDFGSGYNGENLLLELNPDYVKVDMNIIRNIDKDEKRQIVFNNLLSYTKDRNIKVIAEGVETVEEFNYVRNGGVDLVQGYLLGKPAPELRDINPEAKKLFEKKSEV